MWWNRVAISLSVLAWLATTLGFWLALRTSGLSEGVQSAIIIGWLAVGITVMSYFWGREVGQHMSSQIRNETNPTGVIRVFRRRDVDRTITLGTRIESATSDIFFLGLSLPKVVAHLGLLEDKAREGVHIRLLVPDPCEKWLILAIAKFLRSERSYPHELSVFFTNFLIVWKRMPGYFEVRVHKHLPSVSAIMFDGREGHIETYMYGWRVDDRLILELDFDGLAKDFKTGLDALWSEATSIDSEQAFLERLNATDNIAQELSRIS